MLDLLERIKKEQIEFSAAQRQVAAYVVENYYQIPFLSISALSKEIGVSDTTVVNFCNHLGYEKFAEFKKIFSAHVHSELKIYNTLSTESQRQLDTHNLFTTIAEEECANIQATLADPTNQTNLPLVLPMLHQAKHIYITGGRASGLLAERLTTALRFLGLPVFCIRGNVGEYIDQFAHITSNDLVIAFSFPRYTAVVLDVLEDICHRNIPIVLITDGGLSPAYPYAQLAFHCSIHSSGYLTSHAGAFALIDIIARSYAQQHIDNAGQAVKVLEGRLLQAGIFL